MNKNSQPSQYRCDQLRKWLKRNALRLYELSRRYVTLTDLVGQGGSSTG